MANQLAALKSVLMWQRAWDSFQHDQPRGLDQIHQTFGRPWQILQTPQTGGMQFHNILESYNWCHSAVTLNIHLCVFNCNTVAISRDTHLLLLFMLCRWNNTCILFLLLAYSFLATTYETHCDSCLSADFPCRHFVYLSQISVNVHLTFFLP